MWQCGHLDVGAAEHVERGGVPLGVRAAVCDDQSNPVVRGGWQELAPGVLQGLARERAACHPLQLLDGSAGSQHCQHQAGARPGPRSGTGSALGSGVRVGPTSGTGSVLGPGVRVGPRSGTGSVLGSGVRPGPSSGTGSALGPGVRPGPLCCRQLRAQSYSLSSWVFLMLGSLMSTCSCIWLWLYCTTPTCDCPFSNCRHRGELRHDLRCPAALHPPSVPGQTWG